MSDMIKACQTLYRDLQEIYNFLSTNQIKAGQDHKILNSYYLLIEAQCIVEILKEHAKAMGLSADSSEIIEAVTMAEQVKTLFSEIEVSYLNGLSKTRAEKYSQGKKEKEALLEANKEAIAKNLGSIAQAEISYRDLQQKLNKVVGKVGSFELEDKILGIKYKVKAEVSGEISLRKINENLVVRVPINIKAFKRKMLWFGRLSQFKSVDILVDVPLDFSQADNVLGLSVGNIDFSIDKLKLFIISVRSLAKKVVNKLLINRYKPTFDQKLNEVLQWKNLSLMLQRRVEEIQAIGIDPKIKINLGESSLFARVDLYDDLGLQVAYSLIEKYIPKKSLNLMVLIFLMLKEFSLLR